VIYIGSSVNILHVVVYQTNQVQLSKLMLRSIHQLFFGFVVILG